MDEMRQAALTPATWTREVWIADRATGQSGAASACFGDPAMDASSSTVLQALCLFVQLHVVLSGAM